MVVAGFEFEIIKEPKQRHVAAWEQAARSLRNDDAKPELKKAFDELQRISITETDVEKFVDVFRKINDALSAALSVLSDNETLTVTANHGVMVKAACRAGWIVSPEIREEEVDDLAPWQVKAMAEAIAMTYLEVTTIPKN